MASQEQAKKALEKDGFKLEGFSLAVMISDPTKRRQRETAGDT
jgi:hypothetical protein